MNSDKIILDLCGGTGSWSKPYKDAGYDVRVITLPIYDLFDIKISGEKIFLQRFTKWEKNFNQYEREILLKENVYGVLAAPPCTMFSLARTTAATPRNVQQGMLAVKKCMQIIWNIHPKFWVMENPKGLLRQFMGRPAFEFDASEFGEDYNKHTDLWGYFKVPRKTHSYTRYPSTDKNTRKLPAIPEDYKRDTLMTTVAIKRSITPQGFANAFFKANK